MNGSKKLILKIMKETYLKGYYKLFRYEKK